jgi:type I restriction enzyme S subunit
MTEWTEKEICSLGRIVTGKTPPKEIAEYWNGGEQFVSPKDMEIDSLYIYRTQSTISTKALEKFRNQVLPPNAVMYTALSYGFGKIGLANKRLLTNQQINSVIVNSHNNFRFVYYLLRISTPHIFSYNSGIDTPIVPKSVFEKIKLNVPSLTIQRKIAAVLSAYDDLIENNNRCIAILEKMAEELYREWFVRLRFPGHEKTKIIKDVPYGWEIRKIRDLGKVITGKTPPTSNQSFYYHGN